MCRFNPILPLILLLLAARLLSGQQRENRDDTADVTNAWKRFEVSHPLMGVKFGFVIYAKNIDQARAGMVAAMDRIKDLNDCMSDYDPASELSQLCQTAKPGVPTKVSKELMEVLLLADKIHRQTNGSFDPTVAPLSKLWRQARKKKQMPTNEQIQSAKDRVGWQHLKLDRPNLTVTFAKKDMALDLGGIAKGFAADEALRVLREKGLKSCLVDAGGDVTVGDAPPGKKGWTIAISKTDGRKLVLANASVATSGDRFQYMEHEGKRYSHIIDPRTGWGVTNRRLVTVVCQLKNRSGAMADGWASAFSVIDLDLLRKNTDRFEVQGLQIESADESRKKLLTTGMLLK